MSVKTGIKLEGAAELLAMLQDLKGLTSERTSRATVTKEMDKSLQPVAEAARALAPRSALTTRLVRNKAGEKVRVPRHHVQDGIGIGTLRKSQLTSDAKKAYWQAMRMTGDKATARDMLRVQRRAEREAGIAKASPPIERYVGVESGFATLVEFGTGPRRTKSGKALGSMPAQPFLRPAWDEHGPGVMDRLTQSLRVEVAKKIARARKKKGLS